MLRQILSVSLARNSAKLFTNSSRNASISLSGIFPPIPTPFLEDESIAFDRLQENLFKWETIPYAGFVVQGSNGEFPFLTPAERVQVVAKVRESVTSKKLIIAGCGCESTRATIPLCEEMAKVGANAALVITPHYFKSQMTDLALINYFTDVADRSPIPLILYSVQKFTGLDLPLRAIRVLAQHPNIIGMKESSGDVSKMAQIFRETKAEEFQILAGSASYLLPAYLSGCVGGICALANVLGSQTVKLHELCQEKHMDDAFSLQQSLLEPNAAVTSKYGVAGLKMVLDWMGFYGGPTRRPLLKLTKEEKHDLRNIFLNSGFML